MDGEPAVPGIYATLHCWDAQEGAIPGSNNWNGEKWLCRRPIIAWGGPFTNGDAASEWAYAHDPDD